MKTLINQHFETERSLYLQHSLALENCRFEGPSDGESPLKESSDISAKGCYFDLRYPFWHDEKVQIDSSEFTEKSRAAFWYDDGVEISHTLLHGIKAFRECQNVRLSDCDIVSPEFMWRDHHVSLKDCTLKSEYAFFEDEDLRIENLKMEGKYSFQYVKGGEILRSELHTKDAFWHSENLTVRDSVIDGEYLGWYSKNLHLIHCQIKGTQPLCYCQGLVIEDCTMENADFAFEYSEVNAEIKGSLLSVKNPRKGQIVVDAIGEVILKDSKYPCEAKIVIREKGEH